MAFERLRPGLLLVFVCAACKAADVQAGGTATFAQVAAPTQAVFTRTVSRPTVPPPTQTPGPAPREFQEDFDGHLAYWKFMQVDTGQQAIAPDAAGGFLTFDLREPNLWVFEIYDPQRYDDVRVEARVEFLEGEQEAAGVLCRYDENRGWYEFAIYPDQTYVLLFGQWLADGVARYTPLVQASSEKIRTKENEIGLVCQGDTLTPFINGTELRRRQEKIHALATGKIGVSAASFDQLPVTIAYDWVKVSSP
jgi:hypothetical protein